MKQWLSCCSLIFLVATAGGQTAAPICGYPQLHDPQGEVTLQQLQLDKSFLGDRTFKIREKLTGDKINLIQVSFTELYVGDDFVIFGETAEIDSGRIPTGTVAAIAENFASSTAPGSIDPTRGIKAISELLFGPPPQIGDDSKVYILLIDVRDDYVPDSSEEFVAGYFDPLDQISAGNMKNIIYIDTYPGMSYGFGSGLLMNTLAHEYQHLIHYGRDPDEDVWLNEGLSELAPQLMGIAGRDFSSYLADTNVMLDQFGGRVADYARCGLFMTYYFHRFGQAAITALVGDPKNGISSLANQLNLLGEQGLDDLVNHWHQANYFGRRAEYPYPDSLPIPTANIHDEIFEFPTTLDDKYVQRFGANWTLISGGTNLLIRAQRYHLGIAMELFPGTAISSSPPELFTYGYIDEAYGEQYQEIYLLTTGTSTLPDSGGFSLYTSATGGFQGELLAYDNGDDVAPDQMILLGRDERIGGAAVSFQVQGPVYLNNIQFFPGNVEQLELSLTTGLISGVPIFSRSISAPVAGTWNTVRMADKPVLESGEYFVTITSPKLALGFTNSDQDHSYYLAPGSDQYFPVSNFRIDDDPLAGNWNIRLSNLVESEGLPITQTPLFVGNVYPNPISTAQIQSSGVQINLFGNHTSTRVTIYNLLGRQLRTITGRPTGGLSYVTWKGVNDQGIPVPSGIYLARVTAGGQATTRKILVLR